MSGKIEPKMNLIEKAGTLRVEDDVDFAVKGRKFDGDGNYRQWWDDDWITQYNEKANCYVEQYGNVKPTEVGPSHAYKLYLAKHEDAAKIESVSGFDADQLFFLGVAMKSCRKTSEFTLYEQLGSLHAPGQYRVNQVVPNLPAFAEAFHCSPESKMNPKKRCTIW
ncbi:peptidase family M13 [Ostertagia ostertagi]